MALARTWPVVIGGAAWLIICCSSPIEAQGGRAARPSTSSLESRVQQYWGRRQAKDLTGAYPFYCQSYRSRVSLKDYTQLSRLNRFDLTDIKVASIVQQTDRYQVTITYRFMAPMITQDRLDGQATETWKRDPNGQWCKADEPLELPLPPRGFL